MGKDNGRLSAQRMQAEEQHAALMAVAHALTAAQQLAVCAEASRRWPRMQGAKTADILDITVDHDMFLGQTEPFFTGHGAEMPDGLNYAPLFAAHALILLGRDLTVPAVTALLVRAGCADAPDYDPTHDLAVVLANASMPGTAAARAALENLRSRLDLLNVPAAEASLRALYGKDARS
jgi:hypothetical protein